MFFIKKVTSSKQNKKEGNEQCITQTMLQQLYVIIFMENRHMFTWQGKAFMSLHIALSGQPPH